MKASGRTISLILLSVVLLAVTVLWQQHWKRAVEKRAERLLKKELSAVVDEAADFEKVSLRGESHTIRRAAPPCMQTAYRAVDGQGKTIAYVIPFKGHGYQHDIVGMLAVDASAQKILRLRLTEARESPGENLFGESSEFIHQFREIECNAPLRLTPRDDEGIHAVSGASISSQIIVRLVNECIQAVRAHLQAEAKQTRRTG